MTAVENVIAQQEAIDTLLARHTGDWPLERIAPLERSILRLAAW